MNKVTVVMVRWDNVVQIDSVWVNREAAIAYAEAENERIAKSNEKIAMGWGNPEWYEVAEVAPVIEGTDRWNTEP